MLSEYVKFGQAIEPDKFLRKFKEVTERNWSNLPENIGYSGMAEGVQVIIELIQPSGQLSSRTWILASAMLNNFPREDIFPVLDVIR